MVVRSWAELDLDDICAHARVFGFDLDNTLASSKQPMEPAMIARFSALTAHATVALISGGGMDVVTSQVLDVLGPDADRGHLHVMPTSGSRYYRWDGERWALVYAHDLDDRTVAAITSSLERRAKELACGKNMSGGVGLKIAAARSPSRRLVSMRRCRQAVMGSGQYQETSAC